MRRHPSDTTGHTGPYHGGSVKLNARTRIQARETHSIEITVVERDAHSGRVTDTPRPFRTPSSAMSEFRLDTQPDKLCLAPTVHLPLLPLHTAQAMANPAVEITQHRGGLAEPEVAQPSRQIDLEPIHSLIQADAPVAPRQPAYSRLEPPQRFRSDPASIGRSARREAEPQELAPLGNIDRALGIIDLELQPRGNKNA